MASNPEAAGGIYRAVQPKDVIAPPKPERRRKRVKEPKPPRRPGRARRMIGRVALALGLAGATLFTGKTIYDNYIADEPSQNPNPTPTLTVDPTQPPTIVPTTPIDTSPTPPQIVQPVCESYEFVGKPARYGYISRLTPGVVQGSESVLMCGRVVDIIENSHYSFEGGNENFTTIKLFLGLDENGEELYGNFVIAPDNADYIIPVVYLNTKRIPYRQGTSYSSLSIDEALDRISEGKEIVVELPVEDFHIYGSPDSLNLFDRFHLFARKNHLRYNRAIINNTPRGHERAAGTNNYPVGLIQTLYLRT